jgi:FMN phosphatase YigB (HAD superfamily)
LSNGHVRLLVGLSKNAGIEFDVVLSAEPVGTYKTDPRTYETAVRLL